MSNVEAASLRQLLGHDSVEREGTTEDDSILAQEASFVDDVSEDPFAGACEICGEKKLGHALLILSWQI